MINEQLNSHGMKATERVRRPIRVLHLIKTSGIRYDYRLLKQVNSQWKLGADPDIVALEDENRAYSGEISGLKFETIHLTGRRIFPQKKGLTIKLGEFYFRFLRITLNKKPDVVWLHDFNFFGFIFFLKILSPKTRIIWDQHELPPQCFLRGIRRRMLRAAIQRSEAVIVTNGSREDLVVGAVGECFRERVAIIENYPAEDLTREPKYPLPNDVKNFLEGKPFFLMQGYARVDRKIFETIAAAGSFPDYRLLIVGPMEEKVRYEVEERFGRDVFKRIFVTGFIPHSQLCRYLDHASLSLIFYTSEDKNSWYCSPNRLFQAICRGVPVVGGSNPTIKVWVDDLRCGVCVAGDGSSVEEIISGIQELLGSREAFSKNALAGAPRVVWEAQLPRIEAVLDGKPDGAQRYN